MLVFVSSSTFTYTEKEDPIARAHYGQPAHRNTTPLGNNKMAANKQRSAHSFDWAFYASEGAIRRVSTFR